MLLHLSSILRLSLIFFNQTSFITLKFASVHSQGPQYLFSLAILVSQALLQAVIFTVLLAFFSKIKALLSCSTFSPTFRSQNVFPSLHHFCACERSFARKSSHPHYLSLFMVFLWSFSRFCLFSCQSYSFLWYVLPYIDCRPHYRLQAFKTEVVLQKIRELGELLYRDAIPSPSIYINCRLISLFPFIFPQLVLFPQVLSFMQSFIIWLLYFIILFYFICYIS